MSYQSCSRVFRVEDVTAGEPREWIARYRGHLLNEDDTVAAYDQLADAVRPYNITPLFRKERDGKQLIYLVPSPSVPKLSSESDRQYRPFHSHVLQHDVDGRGSSPGGDSGK